MRAREKRKGRTRLSLGITITPLVDIIFLLVLFFIINTGFRQERYIDVQLPESEASQDIRAQGIIVTIRTDGTVAVDDTEIPWEELTSTLMRLGERTGAREVIIRGDENIPYSRAIAALDRVRIAGFDSVSLQTVRSAEGR